MSEEAAPFGAPAKAVATTKPVAPVSPLAPVPMFDPMLAAARDVVQSLGWFRREIAKADVMCSNMEKIAAEMESSKIAEDATRHVVLAVSRLRQQVTKVSDFCERMEGVTADLQGGDMFDKEFQMPRTLAGQR